ncbi:MAG: DUF3108 domain-containing protein [Methylophilaceae bacterium]
MQVIGRYIAVIQFLVLALSGVAHAAAPTKVDVVYQATRNGQPFATIAESYRAENGRYKIESVTTGIGVYALFGKRRLLSEGEITPEGLKPAHFELHQGDKAKKSLFADFDWSAGKLNMQVKGKPVAATLEKGAQDIASFIYQFMFAPPAGDEFNLPVTTGKKLRDYHYKVTERDVVVEIGDKKFKTIHLMDADAASNDDSKELWLGIENHYLPVRLEMRDENGMKIEQTLTSIQVE